MGYIGGWFNVRWHTTKGRIFDKAFPTEEEARTFGNEQWKFPFVVKVRITKMGYYKKRRKSVLIAEAQKKGQGAI